MLRQISSCGRVFVGMLVVGAACLAASQARADNVLRWKFAAGEKTRYVMKMDMTQAMNVMGNAVETKVSQTIDMTWAVDSVDDKGVATMSQTIDRMRMDLTANGGALNVKLDSADKKKPEGVGAMLAPLLDGLVGKPVAMKITARGEINDVKMPQEMLDAFKKVPGADRMGGSMFSEEGFKQMTAQGMLTLPEGAVTEGKSWTNASESKNPILGKQKVSTDYTYQGIETRDGQELAKIATKLTMNFEPPADAPIKAEIKDQTNKGLILFNGAKGRIQESGSTSKIKMQITAMGMTIDQDMTTEVNMKLAPLDSKATEAAKK